MALVASFPRPLLARRTTPRDRLAAGLVFLGGWVCALTLLAPLARASSPAAWKAYDLEVRQACLKASGLQGARVMGQRVDVPELSTSVLLLAGPNPQAPMGGQASRELCLFTQNGRRAVVTGAEPLDRPRWPYPAPGVTLPAPTGGEGGAGGLAR